MLTTQSLENLHLHDAWVTIGSFDGVHLGHQELFHGMMTGAQADSAPVVVVTFHPHPAEVIQGRTGAFYLTLPDERGALFEKIGIDVAVIHPFNKDVAAMTAADFVGALVRHLGMSKLWVGHDFALGRKREGNVNRLSELGVELGFEVIEVDAVQQNGRPISSSLIRELLTAGDVVLAASLLGRAYLLMGEVVHGDQRGRTIGIPTANVSVPAGKLIPGAGVYACSAATGGRKYAAAVNVGVRPTFFTLPGMVHVEAHILDFSGDLYGQNLELGFVQKLRDEERFSTIEALVKQVDIDIELTRMIVNF